LIARYHSTTAGEASRSGKADPLKKSSCGHDKIILPPLLGILSSLIVFELSVKDLDSNIPEKLNHLKSLLLNNSLSGAADNLTSLEQLNLAFNKLSAKFPSTGINWVCTAVWWLWGTLYFNIAEWQVNLFHLLS
jgi:hypothetical protein